MWTDAVQVEIVALFAEAQREAVFCDYVLYLICLNEGLSFRWDPDLLPDWQWEFEKLKPPDDDSLRCACGYRAHTMQQLHAHRHGTKCTAKRRDRCLNA